MPRYWPLDSGRIITSPFGPRPGGYHTGVDFGFPAGSAGRPVYAIQAGTIIYAGAAQGYGGPDPAGWLVIDSSDAEGGGCLEYGHIVREVARGEHVAAGQRIGHINPNTATNGGVAPHLHISDMPRAYNPATKQDVMPRLAGALDPGQPAPTTEDAVTDTIYADVSEWQVPVDDSYPYRVICIRSNDGTYRDRNWATNYAWCKSRTDAGRLEFFLVYFVWRPNWQAAVATLKTQVGQPHPRMAVMIDVESWGGQIRGNQSDGINAAHDAIAAWLGDRRRVIGYGNTGDLNSLWPNKPPGVRLVVAGYGSNPAYPGKIAHQYTDGRGYGDGLPQGASPFGNCDMNSADGLTPAQFAAACGITTEQKGPLMALTDAEQKELLAGVRYVRDQLGPGFDEWGEDGDLGRNANSQRRTLRAGLAAALRKIGAIQ